MKAFLRDLPEPVVTVATYHAIIDAVSKKKAEGVSNHPSPPPPAPPKHQANSTLFFPCCVCVVM